MKFIIWFCLINLVYLREDFKIRTKKIVCDCDKTICDNMQCMLRPIKRNTQALTIGCYLHEPQNDIRVSGIAYFRMKEYRKYLIDVDEDFCAVVNGTVKSRSIMIMISLFKSGSNDLIHNCPYQGNVSLMNFVYRSGYFPSFIPLFGDYRLDIRFYIPKNNQTIINYSIYVSVEKNFLDVN